MAYAIDLTGQKFGRLTVIKRSNEKSTGNQSVRWECVCDCGKHHIVSCWCLRSGLSKSCGCLNIEVASQKIKLINTKHGMAKTKFYKIWDSMKYRVSGKVLYGEYPYITISKEWEKFENFRDDMYASYNEHVLKHGEKNTTIDRINGVLGYCKENCRWATWELQYENRLTNVYLEYNGIIKKIKDWVIFSGINRATFCSRLQRGWSMDKTLYTPIQIHKKHDTI